MDHNRLLLELEQIRKQANRSVISPEIKTLALEDLEPLVSMVAHARAAYVAELFSLTKETGGKKAPDSVDRLRELRGHFEELVAAANALETMIKRGYVDVRGNSGK